VLNGRAASQRLEWAGRRLMQLSKSNFLEEKKIISQCCPGAALAGLWATG